MHTDHRAHWDRTEQGLEAERMGREVCRAVYGEGAAWDYNPYTQGQEEWYRFNYGWNTTFPEDEPKRA